MNALLVIDVQKGLFKKKTAIYKQAQLLLNINKLINKAHRRRARIVVVRHCNDSFLREGTAGWDVHEELLIPESARFVNKRHGSCFQGTGLDKELRKENIDEVVVAGLVTHGCIRASSLDALRLGYKVTLVSDGHSSYNDDAETLIQVWNRRIESAGARLARASEVSFE